MGKCENCNLIKDIHFQENGNLNQIKETLNKHSHLKFYLEDNDHLRSISRYYYCEECYSIYEEHWFLGFNYNKVSFTFKSQQDILSSNAYLACELAKYLYLLEEKEKIEEQLTYINGTLTVYMYESTVKWGKYPSDIDILKTKGYDKENYETNKGAEIFLSLEDFYKRWSYGPQYVENAHLIKFEVDSQSIVVLLEINSYGNSYITISNEKVPAEKMLVVDPMNNKEIKLLEWEDNTNLKRGTKEFDDIYNWYKAKNEEYNDKNKREKRIEIIKNNIF